MIDILLAAIIVFIIAIAIVFVVKQKKSGAKCIGCPLAKTCGQKSCCCESEQEKEKGL